MDSKPIKVLLIEDHPGDARLIREALAEAKSGWFDLEHSNRLSKGLERLAGEGIDIVLLDLSLPDSYGFETFSQVHAHASKIPIVVLTGFDDETLAIKAMQEGAQDYLVKGQLDSNLLPRAMRYAIERKKTEEALRESEKELRFLSSKLLTIQEEERKRIARELHDSIGQSLSAVKFHIESTITTINGCNAWSTVESLGGLVPIIQNTIEEVRRIYMGLRPSVLDDLGILATIAWFCREFQASHGDIRIEKRIDLQESEVPDSLKTVIYRILQEAFNNIAKHSKTDTVHLSLEKERNTILLAIEDKGVGFDLKDRSSRKSTGRGMGLSSMRERTELSGGTFLIESSEGKGTIIRVCWSCS